MFYTRIIVNNDFDESIRLLNGIKKADFAFYDLIYLNKNGASITEDTLKIRVYQKNEWDSKNVLVIRKIAPLVDGVKEDKVLLKEEFDSENDAIKFVKDNFSDDYNYSFKLEKKGVEYQKENSRVWIEDVKDVGISIEIGSKLHSSIEEIIKLFNVKERLTVSLPEYLLNKYVDF